MTNFLAPCPFCGKYHLVGHWTRLANVLGALLGASVALILFGLFA